MKSAVESENRFAAGLTSVPDSLDLGYRPRASEAGATVSLPSSQRTWSRGWERRTPASRMRTETSQRVSTFQPSATTSVEQDRKVQAKARSGSSTGCGPLSRGFSYS